MLSWPWRQIQTFCLMFQWSQKLGFWWSHQWKEEASYLTVHSTTVSRRLYLYRLLIHVFLCTQRNSIEKSNPMDVSVIGYEPEVKDVSKITMIPRKVNISGTCPKTDSLLTHALQLTLYDGMFSSNFLIIEVRSSDQLLDKSFIVEKYSSKLSLAYD